MNRVFPTLAVLILAGLAAAAEAEKRKPKAEIETAREVEVPLHDPESGEQVALLRAAQVTPDPDDTQRLLATTVRILFFQDKKTHVARGAKGRIHMADKTAYLETDVVLVFDDAEKVADRTHVYTDDLLWHGKTGTATTDGPVKVVRPDMTITGVGMTVHRDAAAKGPAEKAAETEPEELGRRGRVVIHRHKKTVIRPEEGQWLAGPAQGTAAEAKGEPKSEPKSEKEAPPIIITCRGPLTLDRSRQHAEYEKDVRAVQERQTITCDRLKIGFRRAQRGGSRAALENVVAVGHVRIDDGTLLALSDHALWRRDTGTLTLIGRPAEVRWDNGNRIAAGSVQRLKNGEILYCTATEEHPANVFLLIYAAAAEAGAKPAEGSPTPPASPRQAPPGA
jgi:LPS export ABC transporter protein LptC